MMQPRPPTRGPSAGSSERSSRVARGAIARIGVALTCMLGGIAPALAGAGDARVAVAANFTAPAKAIAGAFESTTGHRAVLSFGSTGQLFTQITQDAPFDVFLAADRERPARLVEAGLTGPEAPFTYAVGRLVLYSGDPEFVAGPEVLKADGFTRLAIANPVTAPYGAAAMQVLEALGVRGALEDRLVRGTNIAQTYQFVYTGNAELGFVALSQVIDEPSGSRWRVPRELHTPIRQDAILLAKGAEDAAARAFTEFLRGPAARAIIERYGYELADATD